MLTAVVAAVSGNGDLWAWRARSSNNMLALTFDDGPDPRGTPAVLDALARARARATFFVLGERAAAHPELIERTLAEGHAVEVHGHGHLRHPLSTREAVAADLDAALAVLARLGVEPRLWRVPWGDLAPWTEELADERGLALAGWTLDTHDWRGALRRGDAGGGRAAAGAGRDRARPRRRRPGRAARGLRGDRGAGRPAGGRRARPRAGADGARAPRCPRATPTSATRRVARTDVARAGAAA